ncbi:hypothetical protein Acr_00g0070220 [Actinidia rufa]|uniref:Uncharacterized protein n=1 Tax=Actinidia rufa TaxID=165716 RepID=A0A7J0DSK5_9ERIC|nr:hypothetical protein Acr_00g0070220 [Actinidia rufa]
MANKVYQHPPPEEYSPQGRLLEVEIPSSPATELNIMTQGDLDRLWKTCSFPLGVWMRLPRKGETILSAGAGDVAFYEASFATGLRVRDQSRDGSTSRRDRERIFSGGPPTMPRDGRRDFSSSWEMTMSSIRAFLARKGLYEFRGKQCNKVPVLSEIEGERFHWVFEKIGEGGRFKIPVVLDSRTFHKYFASSRVEMSSSRGSTAEGEIRVEAEDDIRGGAVAFVGDASESSHSKDVSSPAVPSRAMPKRIKLSLLAKAMAEKITSSSKGVVISEVSKIPSKKRALDEGSKGKQIAPLPEAKKNKTEGGAHVIPARPLIPKEGSSTKSILGEALGPHAFVMASAATAEKILAKVILPANKEKVEKFTFDQGVILDSSLAFCSRNFAESVNNHCALAESFELKMVRAQNRAIKLEGALAKVNTREAKASKEVKARDKKVTRLQLQVAELEKTQNLTKGRIIAAFKESEDFQEAVVGLASSYFSDGFYFCKKQLAHQYPKLGIDFEDIEMDHNSSPK